jgi:hypothetical protein
MRLIPMFSAALASLALIWGPAAPSAQATPADRPGVGVWRTAEVTSREGIRIKIDYQVVRTSRQGNKGAEYLWLRPVIFNVSGPGLRPGASVRATFDSLVQYKGSCGGTPYQWTERTYVGLKPATEGHFYGDLIAEGRRSHGRGYDAPVGDLTLVQNPYCQTAYTLGQVVSVVVDGNWLKKTDEQARADAGKREGLLETQFLFSLADELVAPYKH